MMYLIVASEEVLGQVWVQPPDFDPLASTQSVTLSSP